MADQNDWNAHRNAAIQQVNQAGANLGGVYFFPSFFFSPLCDFGTFPLGTTTKHDQLSPLFFCFDAYTMQLKREAVHIE